MSVLMPGCRKRPAAAAPAEVKPEPPNPAADLPNLTIAVRAYVMTQGKSPATLDDLVKSGCIPRLPTPPAGKKYAIDVQKSQAVLINQ